MDFVHVREDLVHVLEVVDVQDPVGDVPRGEEHENVDLEQKELENHLSKYLDIRTSSTMSRTSRTMSSRSRTWNSKTRTSCLEGRDDENKKRVRGH